MGQAIRELFSSWGTQREADEVDWHGMLQNGTVFMDGVPGLTQVSYDAHFMD